MESAGLRQTHWRKSSMWSMLTRKHAQAVVDDTEVCPHPEVQTVQMRGWDFLHARSDHNKLLPLLVC